METLVIQVGVNSRGQPQRDQRRIAGEVLRVGRALACELQLADPRVALDHALITITPAGTSIAAVGGALKVNGQATTQAPLVVGDYLGPPAARTTLDFKPLSGSCIGGTSNGVDRAGVYVARP